MLFRSFPSHDTKLFPSHDNEKLDLPILGTNLENFAPSPAIIKSTKIVKVEEISWDVAYFGFRSE